MKATTTMMIRERGAKRRLRKRRLLQRLEKEGKGKTKIVAKKKSKNGKHSRKQSKEMSQRKLRQTMRRQNNKSKKFRTVIVKYRKLADFLAVLWLFVAVCMC